MSPAAWTALITAGIEILKVIDKGIEERELPTDDGEFDRSMKVFRAHQIHLGERFEAQMLKMKHEDDTDRSAELSS